MLFTKVSLFLSLMLINTNTNTMASAQKICNNEILTGNYPNGVKVKSGKSCTLDGADLKGKNIFCEEGCRDLIIKNTQNIEKVEYIKPRRDSALQILNSELEGEVKVSEGKNIDVTLKNACGSSEGAAKLLVEKLTGSSSVSVTTTDIMYSTDGCTCNGLGEVKVVETHGGPFEFSANRSCPLKIKNGILFQKNKGDIDMNFIKTKDGDVIIEENDGDVDITGTFDSNDLVKFVKNQDDVTIECINGKPKDVEFDSNSGMTTETNC